MKEQGSVPLMPGGQELQGSLRQHCKYLSSCVSRGVRMTLWGWASLKLKIGSGQVKKESTGYVPNGRPRVLMKGLHSKKIMIYTVSLILWVFTSPSSHRLFKKSIVDVLINYILRHLTL